MKGTRITHFIVFAAICWIILVCFQVNWLKRSRDLVEEQFDQKVSMALCYAVSDLNESGEISCIRRNSDTPWNTTIETPACYNGFPGTWIVSCSDTTLHRAMVRALDFYDIHLDFEITRVSRSDTKFDPESPYCCSMVPSQADNDQFLSIYFAEKSKFLFKKVWFMWGSSLAILLIILLIFVVTVRAFVSFLFLTARSMKKDKIKGYDLGADDYITKPFDEDELLCKIRAILRRSENNNKDRLPDRFKLGSFSFDYTRQVLSVNGDTVRLTEKENEVLRLLCLNENRVLRRDDAVEQIYGRKDYFLGRSFDVFISRLRKHLTGDPGVSIDNVYKVGFILNVASSADS